MIYIYNLSNSIVFCPISPHKDLEHCEPGWEKFQGFCYKHFTKRQKWEVAEQHCRMCGGHLVSVMSHEELEFINGMSEQLLVEMAFAFDLIILTSYHILKS